MEPRTLIDQLLAEQKQLQTPAARFAEIHGRAPDLADHYRTLIPLTKPGENEQYAFEVSLDRCTGCKACVSACHSLNGLDDHEVWRDTGVLLGGGDRPGWQQTVTTACHHCEDPGCLNGCPVGAYEKDQETGIVRHLDDQCIGCSYCILKCPYDVPKYSKKRGIVRKCDMCHQRLAEGEAPACVQACPTEAIRIVTVSRTADPVVPGSTAILGDLSITRPTTRYTGREIATSALAADREALVPQHAHWPLVFMLVLTQAGIGLLLAGVGRPADPSRLTIILTATILFNAGMVAATLHLGQPLKAWRFFLGLKTSWLSREILAFSLFAPIPLILSALPHLPDFPHKELISFMTGITAVPLGLIAVFTSVMIYQDTGRVSWRLYLTGSRFFGTVASFCMLGILISHPTPILALSFSAIAMLKLVPESHLLRRAGNEDTPWSPDVHSARIQQGPLRRVLNARVIFTFMAAFTALIEPWLAFPLLLLAEIAERQLFFQSVYAPKMPGNFAGASRHH